MAWKKIQVQMEQLELGLGWAQALDRRSLGQILVLLPVGLCVGPEPSQRYKRVGWEGSQAQEGPEELWGTECALYAVLGWSPIQGQAGATWGSLPIPGLELCVLSFPDGRLLPRAHLPGLTLPPAPSLPLLPQCFSSIPPFSLCSSPASLDAFVFSYLALLLQAKLPSGKLQAHLRGLHNLCAYCTHILSLYFPWDGGKGQMGGAALGRVGRDPRTSSPNSPSFLDPQLRYHHHARHQQAQSLRRSHTGAGTRSYLCWQDWQPWWATPCSAALSPSSGQRLLGPQAPGPWAWLRRMKRNDLSSRSQDWFFYSRAFQRPPCLLFVGTAGHGVLPPRIKPLTLTGLKHFLL